MKLYLATGSSSAINKNIKTKTTQLNYKLQYFEIESIIFVRYYLSLDDLFLDYYVS